MGNEYLNTVIKGLKKTLFVALCFSLVINLLMLTGPVYMLQVFDRVLQSRSIDTLIFLTIAAFIALVVLGILDAVRSYLFIRLASWIDEIIGPEMLSASIVEGLNRQNLANTRGLRDILTLRSFLTSPGVSAFLDAPWIPIFLLVIFSLHPVLGSISLIGAVFLILLALANEMLTKNLQLKAAASQSDAEFLAEVATRNSDAVEAMGMRAGVLDYWRGKNLNYRTTQNAASQRSAIIISAAKVFRFILQICILGSGAYLVLQNELSAGGMIAASILMGRALAPVDSSISAWRSAVLAYAAAKRVRDLLNKYTPNEETSVDLPMAEGTLDVKDLAFAYPGQKQATIMRVSFSLKAGEVLGIIGPSAAGKSTLARLLIGNLRPSRGNIRLDGVEISNWASEKRGPNIGYVPQDIELLKGSVQLNIARMGEIDEDAIVNAAQRAGVHDLILGFSNGYETDIGDAGGVLSGGQRQGVALARALYGDPKFLMFDEPNSSLDQVGEEALAKTIGLLKKQNVTQIIISHKPGILKQTDKLLMLNNGQIEAFGPTKEIISKMFLGGTGNG